LDARASGANLPARSKGGRRLPNKETHMDEALKPGDRAPDFDLPTDDGGRIDLAKLRGKSVVLYFYPKDDTSGCTQEALNFSEKAKAFARANAIVIGVSKDSVARHNKFKAKHGLNIMLASDEAGETLAAYNVWTEKNMYGRKYMGIERSTYLIDPKGRIRRIWRKVKVPGHVDEVLRMVNED
jgi:peroxiredoxin Q/BCP